MTPFVAICPDCDGHENLEHMPAGWWPHCRACGESMNVYVRQTGQRTARHRVDGEQASERDK